MIKIDKKELKQIYWLARCRDIKDNKFDKIKEALYELSNLCQYNYETYSDLVSVLSDFSEETLKKISKGSFSNFYREFYKGTSGMPEDYTICSDLLILVYTNYKNITTYEEYSACCEYMSHLFRRNDKKMLQILKHINPILGTLLTNYTNAVDYKVEEHDKNNLDYYHDLGEIERQLLVTFMMYLDKYGYLYQMPAIITNLIVDNLTEEQVKKIATFMKKEDTNIFLAKELLDICYFVYCNRDKFTMNEPFDNQSKKYINEKNQHYR